MLTLLTLLTLKFLTSRQRGVESRLCKLSEEVGRRQSRHAALRGSIAAASKFTSDRMEYGCLFWLS